MNIEVDYNPSSVTDHYFISVSLNDKEAISFDNTLKGHRVVKQVSIEKITHEEAVEKYGKVDAEWDTLVLVDRKFINRYHVKWIDRDRFDTVNGETWETVWEKPISGEAHKKLLYYSQLISDNYENLDQFSSEMEEFENFLSNEIKDYL